MYNRAVLALFILLAISGCVKQSPQVSISENKPESIASGVIGNNMPTAALLDYPHIYFYDTQENKYAIKKINLLDGSQIEINAELQKDEMPSRLLADSASLYLYRPIMKKIYRLDKNGGSLAALGNELNLLSDLSLDGDYFYFTYLEPGNSQKSLARMKKDGGLEVLQHNIGKMFTSILADDMLYFTNETGVFKISKNGGAPALIQAGNFYLNGNSKNDLYLNEFSKGKVILVRIGKNGGKNAVSQCEECSFVDSDDSFIYLKDATRIEKMDENGNAVILAQGDFRWIGMDSAYIYYNDFNTIYRVLKS